MAHDAFWDALTDLNFFFFFLSSVIETDLLSYCVEHF